MQKPVPKNKTEGGRTQIEIRIEAFKLTDVTLNTQQRILNAEKVAGFLEHGTIPDV